MTLSETTETKNAKKSIIKEIFKREQNYNYNVIQVHSFDTESSRLQVESVVGFSECPQKSYSIWSFLQKVTRFSWMIRQNIIFNNIRLKIHSKSSKTSAHSFSSMFYYLEFENIFCTIWEKYSKMRSVLEHSVLRAPTSVHTLLVGLVQVTLCGSGQSTTPSSTRIQM